ncbi:MFS general substrate transporter [Bimuria novae-zelandiae CBS 107.79]|uniref:MFS general substrate transporter n=1 Tax=Bimuria novae-zelandiae CBS 107.79 TaxID=1447943 RepID=A0A6A5VL63_9PLEO|nr:MFS general substrate transporter [Bimuria novae-zelandiae CBS 107.79]
MVTLRPKERGPTIPDAITPASPRADVELITIGNKTQSTIPNKLDDPFLVTFSEPNDASNPKNWHVRRKWAVTDVLSATGFNRIMVSTIIAPALPLIAHEFSMNSTETMMSFSSYVLATAFGPLLIGPLSEVYGRSPVLNASNIWFLVWNIACGFANNKHTLIAARFLAGFGASSIYALRGGVLGDIWTPEQRGRSLGVYLLIPLLGAVVGPIIGGFMAVRTTWRWMFWSTSAFQAVMILVCFSVFRETYAPLVLKRRAERLRKTTGNDRYKTAHQHLQEKKSVIQVLTMALSRPLRLMLHHPVIQLASLIEAFYYGILYLLLASFADLWTQHYHASVELSGIHYIAVAGGELAGSQLGGYVLDAFYRRLRNRDDADASLHPEHRLPLMFPGQLIGFLGLLIYGWTAQYHVHWIAVDIGIFVACFGLQMSGMAMHAYVIDAYAEHTSSAQAATQFLLSLTAFLFPLFAPILYRALGYGWGNSVLVAIGFFIGFPLMFSLWKCGRRWRKESPSTGDI